MWFEVWCVLGLGCEDFDDVLVVEVVGFVVFYMVVCIVGDVGVFELVVVLVVQVVVQLELGVWQQGFVVVVEVGCVGLVVVVWVGVFQVGCEVGDDDGGVLVICVGEFVCQLGVVFQCQCVYGFYVEGLVVVFGLYDFLEIVVGLYCLFLVGWVEGVEVVLVCVVEEVYLVFQGVGYDDVFVVEYVQIQFLDVGVQFIVGGVYVVVVEFVVVGYEEYWYWLFVEQFEVVLSYVDVFGQYQQFCVGCGLGLVGFGFQVEVGKQLEF